MRGLDDSEMATCNYSGPLLISLLPGLPAMTVPDIEHNQCDGHQNAAAGDGAHADEEGQRYGSQQSFYYRPVLGHLKIWKSRLSWVSKQQHISVSGRVWTWNGRKCWQSDADGLGCCNFTWQKQTKISTSSPSLPQLLNSLVIPSSSTRSWLLLSLPCHSLCSWPTAPCSSTSSCLPVCRSSPTFGRSR